VVTTRDLEDTVSRVAKMIADREFPAGQG
jgi:hypothetical protein